MGMVTELRGRGYAALPAPRHVDLTDGVVRPSGDEWGLALSGITEGDIAVRTFLSTMRAEHHADFRLDVPRPRRVELAVQPGAVDTQTQDGRDEQAYRIEAAPRRVRLVANGRPGLLYAVQTFLQLMDGPGVPLGRITDWPEFELRCVHWDTKHHQDRPETLRRYLDQAAAFKINGILFELEDKFEYPSHPIIGAPGAFTAAELQGLVTYALERHIQVIPSVQSPAHMAYVLKHEEFAHLRCAGNNYQICMDEPEARALLFDMYDDVCEATEGADYFFVSTDEVYYAGVCEKFRRPYTPENRSRTWVDYVNAAHKHLAAKGRRVIVWAEYPLLPEHIPLLPPDLLNGVCSANATQTRLENQHGIRQFCYQSTQGTELLFPNYFGWTDRKGTRKAGHLAAVLGAARHGPAPTCGDPIGTITAAWDDSGLHNETFWLGWATGAQAGWTPGAASVEQIVADFMDVFYGLRASGMAEVYLDLQRSARFYEHAHEELPSRIRAPAREAWRQSNEAPPRIDRALVPPALPDPDGLCMTPVFRPRYETLLAEVPGRLAENDRLLQRLHANLARASRNRYNIEVLISITRLVRHFLEMLSAIAGAEDRLVEAAAAERSADPARAAGQLRSAHDGIRSALDGLYAMYGRLRAVWERSRLPKGMSAGGQDFVHVFDDTKDHLADRRPDLSYLVSAEENTGLAEWLERLRDVMRHHAAAHGLDTETGE